MNVKVSKLFLVLKVYTCPALEVPRSVFFLPHQPYSSQCFSKSVRIFRELGTSKKNISLPQTSRITNNKGGLKILMYQEKVKPMVRHKQKSHFGMGILL